MTCLSTHCCFNKLALSKSNQACWSSTKRTSSSSHWKLTCSRHDIAGKKLLNWEFHRFGLTRPELEATIYCTGGEHAHHYATDAVKSKIQISFKPYSGRPLFSLGFFFLINCDLKYETFVCVLLTRGIRKILWGLFS
jgi:hypothetical protein